jgi:FdhE protein
MQRTQAGVRQEPAPRLDALERKSPEWRPWIELLRVALRADADQWTAEVGPRSSTSSAPLLHGRVLRIDVGRLESLLQRLGEVAALRRLSELDVLELAGAAVRQDGAAIERAAGASEVDPGALETVMNLSVWPLLQACGRQLQAQIPSGWSRGYCPVCGAWPVLAELRGLERPRCLRCGRCGADWQRPWLACVYCDERDHERLGSLVMEGQLEGRKIETCSSCHGHLKSLTTLQAIAPRELLVSDLETVELDLAARERGFRRPARPGYLVAVRLTAVER